MMAHFAIRGLRHEAALKANGDPDRLSLIRAVRVVRRKLPTHNAIPPSGEESLSSGVLHEIPQERVVSSRIRRDFRGVKRMMSNFPLRPRHAKPLPPINLRKVIGIIK